jgi:hypothetical protein
MEAWSNFQWAGEVFIAVVDNFNFESEAAWF